MNNIQGLLDKSDYDGYWDYINYRIDDYWLDEKLEEIYPDKMYKGLIPTLVEWIDREDEKSVVWKRILPNENESAICPILMCPDDNDFSCTLIVVEIINQGNLIQWKRIGIDRTNEWEAEKVGVDVEWFDEMEELNFSMIDYLEMLETFRNRMEFDKKRIRN